MPKTVIIGGGVAGLSTAMHLGRFGAGERVTVLEARYAGAGSSSLAVGDVSALYEERDEIAVRVEAIRFFQEAASEVGLEMIGALRVVDTEADRKRLEDAVEAYREWDIEAQVLEPEQLRRVVPDMRADDLAGGLLTPVAGHIDGSLLCSAYLHRATSAGVKFRPQAPVISITRASDHRFSVRTTSDEFAADVVVNAAGPWSASIGDLLSTPTPILNQRHQVCLGRLDQPLRYQMPQFQDSFAYVDSGHGLYVRPESSTVLITGFHYHYAPGAATAEPDGFSHTVDDDYIEALATVLSERFPGLREMGLAGGWAGLYPMAADNHMMIGPYDDTAEIIAATGLGGAGIQLSFSAGRMAAEWVLGREPSGMQDPRAYLPSRPAARL